MKKYFIGAFAVVIALVSFAFTKESNKVVNCDPTIDYVWYQVQPGLQIPCGSYTGITQTQLVLTNHTALTLSDPLGDNNAAGFQLFLGDASTPGTAISTFGCPQNNNFVCYVAYDPADVNSTKFTRITLPSGQIVWAPKTDINKPSPVCSICRPQ